MFLLTLDISQQMVDDAKAAYDLDATLRPRGAERRGGHNKTPQATVDAIKRHINSFPRVRSHYSAVRTRKEYLEDDLSLRAMHVMYSEQCEEELSASKFVYEKVRLFSFIDSMSSNVLLLCLCSLPVWLLKALSDSSII